MKTEVADAIRNVTARMQQALETGRRSASVDAYDVIEALLAIADELDPPYGTSEDTIRNGTGRTHDNEDANDHNVHRLALVVGLAGSGVDRTGGPRRNPRRDLRGGTTEGGRHLGLGQPAYQRKER